MYFFPLNMKTEKDSPKYILPDETYEALVELGEVIRAIRKRKMAEGYKIENGRIVPPPAAIMPIVR